MKKKVVEPNIHQNHIESVIVFFFSLNGYRMYIDRSKRQRKKTLNLRTKKNHAHTHTRDVNMEWAFVGLKCSYVMCATRCKTKGK